MPERAWLDTIIEGDALIALRTLPDASVHSIVSDPPSGISFMGMDWDRDRGGRDRWIAWLTEIMREAYRVLKPGGHMLIWAIPRTSHWTATAIEDAGFELRDTIHDLLPADDGLSAFLGSLSGDQIEALQRLMDGQAPSILYHLFGNGFPKTMDVGKAIDKRAGAKRKVIGPKPGHEGFTGESTHVLSGGWERPWMHDAEAVERYHSQTAPATDAAKAWDGWHTALKPVAEHWILARKPIAHSALIDQVLDTGTGALNIGALKVGDDLVKTQAKDQKASPFGTMGATGWAGVEESWHVGRWPAHLRLMHTPGCVEGKCAEGCPAGAIDRQGGTADYFTGFRYSAKPDGAERHAGCDDLLWARDDDQAVGYRLVDYATWAKLPKKRRAQGNIHPTLKGIDLMHWLITLITPPGGTVCDMFCGSGSTLVAAIQGGWHFVGCDRQPEYVLISRRRTAYATAHRIEDAERLQPQKVLTDAGVVLSTAIPPQYKLVALFGQGEVWVPENWDGQIEASETAAPAPVEEEGESNAPTAIPAKPKRKRAKKKVPAAPPADAQTLWGAA